jgi:hypothetical protein
MTPPDFGLAGGRSGWHPTASGGRNRKPGRPVPCDFGGPYGADSPITPGNHADRPAVLRTPPQGAPGTRVIRAHWRVPSPASHQAHTRQAHRGGTALVALRNQPSYGATRTLPPLGAADDFLAGLLGCAYPGIMYSR